MWWDSPHKHKQSHTHPLNWFQNLKKKGKKTQRMWRPLCFHWILKWKKNWKIKWCVCGGNGATHNKKRTLHTHHRLFSTKKIKKEKKKKLNLLKAVCVCKKYCTTHAYKYSLSSKGRAHALRGDAGSNPAGSIVSMCVCVCACVRTQKQHETAQLRNYRCCSNV